ncbi:MAG: hypothetical protein E7527_03835 [Ruminococcaceae bacterium]|nr:hypothetical protein [Oscillospiraceae bacterium]
MKRWTAVLLCLCLCLLLSACGGAEVTSETDASVSQNGEAKAVLTKVLACEQSFTFTNMYDRVTEETLDQFKFSLPYESLYVFVPSLYAFADRDTDGVEELLIQDARIQCLLTLDYNDGKVTGTINDSYNAQDYQDLTWVKIEP